MEHLLAVDLGTGSVKALVVDAVGQTIGRGSADYPISRPRSNWAEQDPAEWRRATVLAVRQALDAAASPEIAAIGLSGQMHGTVLIDRAGASIRPPIIWADGRSAAEAGEITENVGAQRLIGIAGSPVVSGFQAATCRWLARHEPGNWARAATVLTPKDEIRRWLTGEIATEPSDASATLLFDITRGDWSPELLDAADVQRAQLPRVIESTDVSGLLLGPVAAEFGLPPGIPVSGGVADAPSAALAAGVATPESLLVTISTGAQALIPADRPMIDIAGRIHSFCGPLHSPRWYAMGATMSAGMSLRWLRDSVFELQAPDGYDVMTAAAARVAPGSGGLLFLPYLAGERTPMMDPRARGAFIGLTGAHARGHLARAVLEGVAFSLFEAFSVLRQLGAAPTRVVMAGGGARSPLWRQILADVFRLPVVPALDPDQSAVGAAMTAGSAVGLIDLAEACRAWPRFGAVVAPNEAHSAVYRELLSMFRSAYGFHKADFARLAEIDGGKW